MDFERLAFGLLIWAIALGCLSMGLWHVRWKRRLRARGVEVEAVRTGRKTSGNEYASPSYEVRFTTMGGEAMTAMIDDSAEVQFVVYDPEQPMTVRRLGPISFRYGPMSASKLNSMSDRVGDWTWTIVGLFFVAVGVGVFSSATS